MHCKSLWIKASDKCINVNVNVYISAKCKQVNKNPTDVVTVDQRSVTGEAERGQQQMETLVSADLSVAEALQLSEHALVQSLDAHRLHTTAGNPQTQPEMSHNTAVPTGTPEEH